MTHMPKSPAFQFYPDDFMGSPRVSGMTVAELGIYVLLLCYDWNGPGIELDSARLARACRVTEREFVKAWRTIGGCFVERDGRWYNPRLERERQKQNDWRAKCSIAGRASAQLRGNGSSATVQQALNTPSPSPSLSKGSSSTARARAFNGDQPTRPHLPAVMLAPPFCLDCQGEPNEAPSGRITGIRHTADCPRRATLTGATG